MPNASNTDRVRGGDRRHRDHRARERSSPCRARRPRSDSPAVFPEAAAGRPLPRARARLEGRAVRRRRHRLHRRGRRRDRRAGRTPRPSCGTPSPTRASCRPGSGRATRCASRPGCRCTVTSSAPASPRCRPASAGWSRGTRPSSAARRRSPPNATGACTALLRGIATEGRRPPRADCAVLVDGAPVGTVTSGNFSPVLEHGIALGVPAARCGRGHRGGHRRARLGAARPRRAAALRGRSTERFGGEPSSPRTSWRRVFFAGAFFAAVFFGRWLFFAGAFLGGGLLRSGLLRGLRGGHRCGRRSGSSRRAGPTPERSAASGRSPNMLPADSAS